MIHLIMISEESFYNLNIPKLFEDSLGRRKFALIYECKFRFKMAWQSELIQPVIKEINSVVFCNGIDEVTEINL